MRNVEVHLVERRYIDFVEKGSVDSGHEVLQVLVRTSEVEMSEGGEGGASHQCGGGFVSSAVMIRRRGVENDAE